MRPNSYRVRFGTAGRTGPICLIFDVPRLLLLSCFICECSITVPRVSAQPYVFTTIAGSPGQYGTNDGPGSAARFRSPWFLATDTNGSNIYVSDKGNGSIRRIQETESGWVVITIPNAVHFQGAEGIAVDDFGDVFVADAGDGLVRKLAPDGTNWAVTVVATNIPASGLAVDGQGNIYISDIQHTVIRKLTQTGTNWSSILFAGIVDVFGSVDGLEGEAQVASPDGFAADRLGGLYFAESWSYTVRKVTPVGTNRMVSTLAGSTRVFGSVDGTNDSALFYYPTSVALDRSGAVFVADAFSQAIRKMIPYGDDLKGVEPLLRSSTCLDTPPPREIHLCNAARRDFLKTLPAPGRLQNPRLTDQNKLPPTRDISQRRGFLS